MIHFVEQFLQTLDDILDGASRSETYSFLRGELTAFFAMGYVTEDEYAHYSKALLNKEFNNEKN